MKKASICILLPFFLLNGSLRELFKFPALYTHYLEHRDADNCMGMLDFLTMHYIGDDFNAKDQDRDMQLPFKKTGGPSFEVCASPVSHPVIENQPVFPPLQRQLTDLQDFNLTTPSLNGLFRPPII